MDQVRDWYEGLERRARIGVAAAAVVLALALIYVVKPFSVSFGDREVPCGPAVLTFGEQERFGRDRTLCADASRSRLFAGVVVSLLAIGGAAGTVAWFDD